jgi:hypothetical protein
MLKSDDIHVMEIQKGMRIKDVSHFVLFFKSHILQAPQQWLGFRARPEHALHGCLAKLKFNSKFQTNLCVCFMLF